MLRLPGVRNGRVAPPWIAWLLGGGLALALAVGILGRGFWTPDEPREADIAWRMSWQPDKSVPLLAGVAFCEKPPLTYWIAAASIGAFGAAPWAARLPNLLYALITALAVGALGRRSAGPVAGVVAAAAISTFLLSYQVAIWLATDAPLLAAVSVALLGLQAGYYADDTRARLRGYTCMHAALACGFLSKSAAAWMVPALALPTLIVWERRWRELWRWELYAGVALQAAVILCWVGFVYAGADGAAHLKVFFWNNLVGRFAQIDAPGELQYAAAHRNSPGKYFVELPLYLWPWTLLVLAALRRAWQERAQWWTAHDPLAPAAARGHTLRFAMATLLPTLAVLSVAATARNIYLAPALPGTALLLGWWARESAGAPGRWDTRALVATAWLLLLAAPLLAGVAALIAWDSWSTLAQPATYVAVVATGSLGALLLAAGAARAARVRPLRAQGLALLAYCLLLGAPAGQIYRRVDAWQDLGSIGRAIGRDAAGRELILFAQDETTRALVDLYARSKVTWLPGPIDPASLQRLRAALRRAPSLVVAQLPAGPPELLRKLKAAWATPAGGAAATLSLREDPAWMRLAGLRVAHEYVLPNGRRYALLAEAPGRAAVISTFPP